MKKQYKKAKLDIFPLRKTDVIACSNYDTNQSYIRGYYGVSYYEEGDADNDGNYFIW